MEALHNTTLDQLPFEEPFIAEKIVKSYWYHGVRSPSESGPNYWKKEYNTSSDEFKIHRQSHCCAPGLTIV